LQKDEELNKITLELELLVDKCALAMDYLDIDEYKVLSFSDLKEEVLKIVSSLKPIESKLERIIKAQEGFKVALIGEPNVGKSTIFNLLAQESRARVSPISGTTRDYLTYQIELEGIKVLLIDTAGLRQSADHVEGLGINKSYEIIDCCDLALIIEDSTKLNSSYLEPIKLNIKEKGISFVNIVNKIDLNPELQKEDNKLYISALQSHFLTIIQEELIKKLNLLDLSLTNTTLSSIRQLTQLNKAISTLSSLTLDSAFQLDYGLNYDYLLLSLNYLNSVLGKGNFDVLNDIFSKICIGK
jgi:tRNA modification GTPase